MARLLVRGDGAARALRRGLTVVGPGDATISDDDAQDRAWMVERMEKAGLLFDDAGLDHLDSEPPDVVAQTFAEVTRVMDDQGWLHELVRDVHESRERRR